MANVTPVCPTVTTSCNGNQNGQVNGVIGFTYYRDYDFCNTTCNVYSLEFDACCRNNAITSLTGPGGNSLYVGTVQINKTITPCNNSPVFNNPPIPYICSGQSYTFNQGAFDPDGDSLVFSVGPCFQGAGNQVSYAGGFTPTQPLGPGWTVAVNSLTGDLTVTPTPNGPLQVAVICLVVEEYRNNVKIGQVVRDIQVTVVDCAALGQVNTPPTITQLTNLSPGLTANGLVIDACACDLVQFDLPSQDLLGGTNFKMFWFSNLPGSSFAAANNPLVPTDTVFSTGTPPTGQFSWVPTKTGVYQFLVTVEDDGCPLLGINQYSIVINVNSCSLDPYVNITNSSCYGIDFEGIPCGGAAPFTYAWSGAGGLSGTGSTISYTYPGPGTYPYSLTVTDSTGVSSSVSGVLNLQNTATANGGPDLLLCPGDVGTIGTPTVPGYTYQWSSPNNLGWSGTVNPTTAQATVALNNGTSNAIVIPYVLVATDPNGCSDIDTVFVTYTPRPPSNFNVTNTVCLGSPATAVYTSPAVPGASYTWTYGGGGTGTSIGPGPHNITFPTAGTQAVTLSVSVNGCVSNPTTRLVKVNPIPTSTFSITPQICAGQPAAVNYTGSANPTGNTQFIWNFDGGNGVGGAGPFTLNWLTPGVKNVTLTVVENGCVGPTFTQQINVFPVPSSNFTLPATVCVD
ncbi:MAG: PKD domain-containing protein, partial [Bacteroidia bacterium]|nr:PKD domain-containing protein [Bacteroidia bacterium]